MSFVKMERGWLDSEMFSDASYSERDAWMWMICEARFAEGIIAVKGKPVTVGRGQLYSSIRFMSEKFQWSKDRVSRYLERLKKWGAISVETATGQNLITISNYNEYQSHKDAPKDTSKDSDKDAPKDKQEEILINSKNVLEGAPNAPLVAEIPEHKPEKKTKNGTRLPSGWVLPDAWGDWAMSYSATHGLFDPKPFVIEQGGCFRRYWAAKAGKSATKLDWEATWQNWVIKGLPEYILKTKRLEREKSYEQVRRGR